MAPDSQTQKLFLLLLGFTLVLSTASAENTLGMEDAPSQIWDNDLWMEDNGEKQVTNATCKEGDPRLYYGDKATEGNLTAADFKDLEEYGEVKVKLECGSKSRNNVTNHTLEFLKLTYGDMEDGEGFVESVLGESSRTEAIEIDDLKIEGSEVSENSNINFDIKDKELKFEEGGIELEESGENLLDVLLYPTVVEYVNPEDRIDLVIGYGKDEVEEVALKPRIHPWRVTQVREDLPRQMDFRDINNGEFEYRFDAANDDGRTRDLLSENFTLRIKSVDEDLDYDETHKDWLESEEPENGDYRVWLENLPSDLETGTYRFTLNLDYGDESFILDSTRVEKRLSFSGTVRNSRGSGVKTNMILKNDRRDYPVNTGSDGIYSTYVVDEVYSSVNLDFYDKGKSSSDASFSLSDIDLADLAKESYISQSSESVSFEYWNDPIVEVQAVKPVNMMAVKFAHSIGGTAQTSMKFNPQNINPENLKVFECDSWNFQGKECMSEWNAVSDEQVSVNYANWKVNIDNLDLHEISKDVGGSEKDILMNAYIVGTSANLVLNGGLTISGPENGRVATGSEITVEGNINSENEKAVEGADVEVSFHKGDAEISSLETAQTDVTGRFTATGEAPEDPGNYSVKITAEKENYNSMGKKFDNRFETFIKEGISIETGGTVEVKPGEDVTSDITVQNIGQTDMEDISLRFEGMDSQYYSVSEASFDNIPAGEEKTTELTVSLPSDYCDNGCGDWPTLEVSATANNPDGDEFETGEETLQVQISRTATGPTDSEGSDTKQATSETEEANESEPGFSESVSELENATGEFLGSQSSLNLALGLIMVFMMILAGAVKKDENGGKRRRSSRTDRNGRDGRPRIQKPSVAGGSDSEQANSNNQKDDEMEKHVESHAEAIASSDSGKDENEERPHVRHVESEDQENVQDEVSESEVVEKDGEKRFVCEETGEEFDTETALKLHKKMNGLI